MQPIHRWQQQYLGTTTLPRTLGVAELQAFFVYSSDQIAQIKSRRTAPLRLAAAIQLGFMRMSGSPLADLHTIPARLMRFVAARAQVPVVPVAIRGSRELLSANGYWPRQRAIEVIFGEPLLPPPGSLDVFAAAVQLRRGAREIIAHHLAGSSPARVAD